MPTVFITIARLSLITWLFSMRGAIGSVSLFSFAYMMFAYQILRMLLAHLTWRAFSLALFSAGRRMDISNAMMPITTRSSTSVKPRCLESRPEWSRVTDMIFLRQDPAFVGCLLDRQ